MRTSSGWPLPRATFGLLSLVRSLMRGCPQTGVPAPMVDPEINAIVQANAERLDAAVDYSRDME